MRICFFQIIDSDGDIIVKFQCTSKFIVAHDGIIAFHHICADGGALQGQDCFFHHAAENFSLAYDIREISIVIGLTDIL